MKRACFLAAVLALAGVVADTPTVTAVTARQRYPWNGFVDITVTLSGASNDVAQATCTFTATNCATHTALAVAHVASTGTVTGAGMTWTRHYVWDAPADVGEVKIDDVELNVEAEMPLGGVQLWENGPYWAECNVGASKPEEYGYYFWWGDTVGCHWDRINEGWLSVNEGLPFEFSSGNCPTYNQKNATLKSLGFIDAAGQLVAEHDAAATYLGTPWRMPTNTEMKALVSNCETMWITTNGVTGRLVTGKGAFSSKSIFLPAAGLGNGLDRTNLGVTGCYWSSTLDDVTSAWCLRFDSSSFGRASVWRYAGWAVRPLRGFAQ